MKQIIRIEHPDSGYGIFRHRFSTWEYISAFFDRHGNLPTPNDKSETKEMNDAFGFLGNDYLCAYKSDEQVSEWILKEEFEHIIEAGFRFYLITIENCIIG